MAVRGFLSGVFWGGIVSALGLGVASQMTPMPGAKNPVAPMETAAVATPDAVLTPAKPVAPAKPAPETKVPEAVAAAPVADPAPTPEPEKTVPEKTAPAKPAPEKPAEVKAPAVAAPKIEPAAKPEPVAEPAPAEPTPTTAEGEAAPAAAKTASVDPAPAAPAPKTNAPKAASDDPANLAKPEGAIAAPTPPVVAKDTAPKPGDLVRPVAPVADPTPDVAELPPVPPLTAEEQAVLDQAKPADTAPEAVAEPAPEVPATPDPETAPKPQVVAIAPAPTPEPTQPLAPTPGLTNTAEGVTVGRLPTISAEPKPAADGDAAPDDPDTGEDAGVDAVPTTADPAPGQPQTPLQQFAAKFENPEKKPLFAVILIDTGGPNVDRKALAQLPFPVTFAIDPAATDASTAAAIYREAGQEVMMLATGIPPGANAADLEVSFQANAAALPEAVAVLDLEDGGFQNDRPLATEVVPVIKGQGRGIVTWDKGLNAGEQVARRDGVPSAMVFRRLDGANENAPTVRRYLDRAAFKAAQDGAVAVVGQTSPETVAALMEWAVEGRSASVALAPITAVLSKP